MPLAGFEERGHYTGFSVLRASQISLYGYVIYPFSWNTPSLHKGRAGSPHLCRCYLKRTLSCGLLGYIFLKLYPPFILPGNCHTSSLTPCVYCHLAQFNVFIFFTLSLSLQKVNVMKAEIFFFSFGHCSIHIHIT